MSRERSLLYHHRKVLYFRQIDDIQGSGFGLPGKGVPNLQVEINRHPYYGLMSIIRNGDNVLKYTAFHESVTEAFCAMWESLEILLYKLDRNTKLWSYIEERIFTDIR